VALAAGGWRLVLSARRKNEAGWSDSRARRQAGKSAAASGTHWRQKWKDLDRIWGTKERKRNRILVGIFAAKEEDLRSDLGFGEEEEGKGSCL
jgi:hypothetical protein